jgi:hypothetical protein
LMLSKLVRQVMGNANSVASVGHLY